MAPPNGSTRPAESIDTLGGFGNNPGMEVAVVPPEKIEHVKRLLAEGKLRQYEIAAATGVSRGTIGRIVKGKWPDYEARRRKRHRYIPLKLSGPSERCPGCGRLIQMPCPACAVTRVCRPYRLHSECELELELRGADRERHEALVASGLEAER